MGLQCPFTKVKDLSYAIVVLTNKLVDNYFRAKQGSMAYFYMNGPERVFVTENGLTLVGSCFFKFFE